ncbi:MAG TPA: glycosyltransferase [Flavobacteriaceae bacterium]|nr:glycosyltransferase [Flavobacteriaceae bacterium]
MLFNKSDLIISNSFGVDKDLKSLMNISTNTRVVYNPFDLKDIALKKNVCQDMKFDFKNNIKYIISVGRLIPLKRNKDLINAFYILQKDDSNLELIFLGDGILKKKLQKICQDLNISKKVYFLGNVRNPFFYLNNSDLFVMNSEIEGFPNVLVEAMACGLPVISSNCKSGPKEILENGKYGLLYPVGNVNILIEKMQIYLYNNLNKSILKENNFKRVKDFNINKILKEYKEAIGV